MVLCTFFRGRCKFYVYREYFLQILRNSGFPLEFGSFEYLCRTTLIPYAISCCIVRTSCIVRLSMSIDKLFTDEERAQIGLILCLSMCVLVLSS